MKGKMNRISVIAMMLLLASFILGACGTQSSSTTKTTGASNTKQTTDTTTQSDKTQATTSENNAPENVYMMIGKGVKLGSDGKMHDAYVNGDIKITKGQKVTITIYNYDDMEHTYTAPDLGLNIKAKGAKKDGQPGVTQYTFTPGKVGTFKWYCADPCDDEANGWAMTHDGFMKGTVTVLPETNKTQYVSLVVNAGIELGSDGKMHDAYTPGDITIKAGQPVQLTVYNFDDGEHTFTSKDMNVNLTVKGSTKKGVPSVSTATFTADKAGKYQWNCMKPCDGENSDWSMTHDGYMMGFVTAK